MGGIGDKVSAFIAGIIGLAILAVILSNKSQTTSVITTAGQALSNIITAAVAPVTGSSGSNTTSNLLGAVSGMSNIIPSQASNPFSMLSGSGLTTSGLGSFGGGGLTGGGSDLAAFDGAGGGLGIVGAGF